MGAPGTYVLSFQCVLSPKAATAQIGMYAGHAALGKGRGGWGNLRASIDQSAALNVTVLSAACLWTSLPMHAGSVPGMQGTLLPPG